METIRRIFGLSTKAERLKALDARAARRRELRLGVEAALYELSFAMRLAY